MELRAEHAGVTAAQAIQVREQYPELFEYLVGRERTLLRTLRHAPSPADIELSATYNRADHLSKAMKKAGPGLEELCRDSLSDNGRTGW